jgi:K+/H+ antiporter YhaU regulatory subunit KhtT
MNKTYSRTLLFSILAVFIGIAACKKKEEEPAKTLNKSVITNNKFWHNKGSSIVHYFRSDGVYTSSGTWKWVNNSDTMEIVPTSTSVKSYWKFFWSTDHELQCQRVSGSTMSAEIFKDQAW